MRLIDADVLLEQMQPVSEFKINSYAEAAAMAIANAYIKLVENQPTVDTTTHDPIPAETGKNDDDKTSGGCISRTQAIDTLRKMQTYKLFAGDDMLLIDQAEAQTELMMLPSILPERPRGHWVEIGDEPYDEWECDVCGFVIDGSGCIDPEEYRDVYRFCPNCGADMRGDKHETD